MAHAHLKNVYAIGSAGSGGEALLAEHLKLQPESALEPIQDWQCWDYSVKHWWCSQTGVCGLPDGEPGTALSYSQQ